MNFNENFENINFKIYDVLKQEISNKLSNLSNNDTTNNKIDSENFLKI